MSAHQIHMRRAIELAQRATGCTSPNPLVGAVVVNNGEVVGEGWHKAAGRRHAEFVALSDAGARAEGATLYITLEPCNHHGRTPPCTDAILASGVREVIYAVADPNPKAAGGAERLKSAGIKLQHGVLEAEALHLNRAFFQHLNTARPWVIAKTASSLDGRVATYNGHSQWITGSEARQRGHELRQAVDAIIIGCQSVIDDDPSLTVRLPESTLAKELVRHPKPIILDSTGRAPLHSLLLSGTRASETLLVTTQRMSHEHRSAVVCWITWVQREFKVFCSKVDLHCMAAFTMRISLMRSGPSSHLWSSVEAKRQRVSRAKALSTSVVRFDSTTLALSNWATTS